MTRPSSTLRELDQAAHYIASAVEEFTAYIARRYPDLSKHHAMTVAAAIIGAMPSLYEENKGSELDAQLDQVVAEFITEI